MKSKAIEIRIDPLSEVVKSLSGDLTHYKPCYTIRCMEVLTANQIIDLIKDHIYYTLRLLNLEI
jgi:hypothetical protein